jgi:hypothetical protein
LPPLAAFILRHYFRERRRCWLSACIIIMPLIFAITLFQRHFDDYGIFAARY